MSLYETLYPYFYKLQFWHLVVAGGSLLLLTRWHMEKRKLDRENADYKAYDEAMKKIEKEKKEQK